MAAAAAEVGEGSGEAAATVLADGRQGLDERRMLRSRYLEVKDLIGDEWDDMTRADSGKFQSIITEVERLHQLVQRPREQIADAEALLDIANTLVTTVRSQSEGITPADFANAMLKKFGQRMGLNAEAVSLCWGDVGLATSHIFMAVPGCGTMVGPMNTKMKLRVCPMNTEVNLWNHPRNYPLVTRKRTARPLFSTCPEQLPDSSAGAKTDTDMNMAVIFDILRRKKSARLEYLVLNRMSFAQTVENIFALSFLVKDGRVEINMDANGHHIVYPRNAPAASAIASGEAAYRHFVFRFDFKDWKLMKDVADGEELMPHRSMPGTGGSHHPETFAEKIPIRKLSRNRGLVQDEMAMEDAPETKTYKRRCLFQDQK